MISKNALLAGIAGALIFAAPALAQDAASSSEAPATQDAQPSSLTLSPGSTVKSKDGTELGKLVGVQTGAAGQELTVRGADGQVRPVSVNGIKADGSDIQVDASLSDFQSATPIASEADTPAPAAAEPTPPLPTDPADSDQTDADETTPPDQPQI